MDALTRIERALEASIERLEVKASPPRLTQAIRYAIFPGGARVRPRLCLAVSKACGDDEPQLAEAAAAAIATPNTKIIRIMPIREITRPAIAKPLGFLNIPTIEKISPNNHKIHPRIGTHPRNSAIKAKTNPATPMPLPFFSAF